MLRVLAHTVLITFFTLLPLCFAMLTYIEFQISWKILVFIAASFYLTRATALSAVFLSVKSEIY